ncbi:MAG: metal-dependent transcriptional regulator [Prevotella sp.]|nr:metal-dependent transcriptional regulator [Prevotella sp.]
MNELSYSKKKYLFAIYKLGQNGGEVKSSEVAKLVGVSKASTAAMTAKLCESGYIQKEHYGQISLTETGIKTANPIYTNYVIIRDFFENTLGLESEAADGDAVKTVVHASETAVDRLAEHILKNAETEALS